MSTDSEVTEVTGHSPTSDSMAQLEINVSNTNADSQTVLNDLRLLELLCTYPFLFSCQVSPHQDVDYDKWGWEQVAKAFNESYEGTPLSSPFTMAELQWRWDILRPLITSLARAKGQIPEPLWKVVVNVHNRLQKQKPKKTITSSCQDLILSQLPLVEELSHSQRLRLEVEFLDLLLHEERLTKTLYDEISTKVNKAVQGEYDEFFAAIKVKELPPDTLQRLTMEQQGSSIPVPKPKIVNANETGLVISSVFSKADEAINGTSELTVKSEPVDELAAKAFKSPMPLEEVPTSSNKPKGTEAASPQKEAPKTNRNISSSLRSFKYSIRPLRIRVKRVDLDEYMPLAAIRRSSRYSGKR